MIITAFLFEAGLKCLTKCFLRSVGELEAGNAYADWVRTKSDSYRGAGIKRLMAQAACDECISGLSGTGKLKTVEWRLAVDIEAHAHNLESSIHALERIPPEGRDKPVQFIPIRFTFFNKVTRDDKLLLAFDGFVLSEMLGQEVSLGFANTHDFNLLASVSLWWRAQNYLLTEVGTSKEPHNTARCNWK